MSHSVKQASTSPAGEGTEGGTVGPRQDTDDRPTRDIPAIITRQFALSAERRLATLEREMRSLSGDVVALEEDVKTLKALVREMRAGRYDQ